MVMAMKGGRVVDQFVGQRDKAFLEQFTDSLVQGSHDVT